MPGRWATAIPASSTPAAWGAPASGQVKRSTAPLRVGDVRRVWRRTSSATTIFCRSPSYDDGMRRLAVALALNAAFLVVEIAGGLAFSSLALLADAAHMASDVVALGLAVAAAGIARRPATPRRSFGLARTEVL